jgi:superoxide dismutase, Cu-Zn family
MPLNRLIVVVAVAGLCGCGGSVGIGVGVGGSSGSVGGGVGVSTDVGGRTTGSQLTVTMYEIDAKGVGDEIGPLMLADTNQGLRIEAALNGLTPGDHGFHLHEKGSCEPGKKDGKPAAGIAAGDHFDPDATGKHLGPQGRGHRGDLPALHVDANGSATGVVFAPHLKIADVYGKSFMIHAGGDNYSDKPEPLGGGGARVACGTVH